MARGRAERPQRAGTPFELALADLRSQAARDPETARALVDLETHPPHRSSDGPAIDASDVARLLSWEGVIEALRRQPMIADQQLSLAEGDYNDEEEYETFGITMGLGELLHSVTASDPDASWEATVAALADCDPSTQVQVVEGDYGWEGWEEFEVSRSLDELLRSALATALWGSAANLD